MKNLIWLLGMTLFFTGTFAHAGKNTKSSGDWAKKECLAENPNAKGKVLQNCIKRKKLKY